MSEKKIKDKIYNKYVELGYPSATTLYKEIKRKVNQKKNTNGLHMLRLRI